MAQSTQPPLFSSDSLERQIEEEFRKSPPVRVAQPTDSAPPSVQAPALSMPEYVEHREGATEIGKLSAEAVVNEYELAAREIESMGVELIERVKQCEDMTRDTLSVIDEMKETAARYRTEAKRIFLEIEDCSLVTAEVRKICSELTDKIAGQAMMPKPKRKSVPPTGSVS